ncbi:MAG: heparinase II/III family protein [Bryobacteraceae bacterium]
MKRREFLLTPALAAAQASAQRSSPNDWTAARPRLYFSSQTAADLRARVDRDPAFKQKWTRLMDGARRLLDASFVTEEVAARGGGQHANYGQPGNQISAMGLTLGLAYHVTGEKPYAGKLRDALLDYAGYQRWNGPGQEGRAPQWHSELNGARFCFGFGVGYDAIHQFLTAAERKQIADAMVRLGIMPALEDWVLPEKRLHALDSMGHNWWAVCVSMAGVCALSLLGEDDRVPQWLDRISRGLALWFGFRGNVLQNKSITFDRAGAFYEGVNYANYALGEYLKYRLAYANVFPNRRQPRFQTLEQATDFFLQTLYPTASSYFTVNFGDSGLHNNSSASVRLLVENGFAHPNAGWYLSKTSSGRVRFVDGLELLARQTAPAEPPDRLPQSILYRDIGWAILRSSWKDDATMLAVKSGFTWNHAHADAGSFVLFHNGAPLITDSGTCEYTDPLYGGYYVQSRAHNVILFNGEGQPAEDIRRGVKIPGRVDGLLDGMGVKYVYSDAAGPMARHFTRNYRHWLWVGGAILVFDDIRAHQEGRLDWLLHHDGAAAEVNGSKVTLTNGNAKAEIRFLFPEELTVREEMGHAERQPSRKVPYLVFSPKTPSREEKFLAAILPYAGEGGAAVPTIEPLSGPEAMGVRVKQAGEVTDVYLNLNADGRRMHDNSNNVIDGWETDAYLFAVTRPEKAGAADADTVTRYFVSCGSYLRRSGRVLLDSLSKVDAIWQPGSRTEVLMEGQDEIEAAIGTAGQPASVVVNGRNAEFQYAARTRMTAFRVSGR